MSLRWIPFILRQKLKLQFVTPSIFSLVAFQTSHSLRKYTILNVFSLYGLECHSNKSPDYYLYKFPSMLEELEGVEICFLWKGIMGKSSLTVALFSQCDK